MTCSFCLRDDGHDFLCPYYEPPKPRFFCAICKDGILNGEEYVQNQNGNYAHWDCAWVGRELVKFLGIEVKVMEENDE